MKKTRGLRLKHKLVKVCRWFTHGRTKPRITYLRLNPRHCASRAMSILSNWTRSLRDGAKVLCSSKPNSGYIRVDQEPAETKPVSVPKGHLAVYVGEQDNDTCRILVPVIYFNHPLFGDLLKEAEKVYGFHHSGGIQIPCRKSEFESVKMQIAASAGNRRRRWNMRNSH